MNNQFGESQRCDAGHGAEPNSPEDGCDPVRFHDRRHRHRHSQRGESGRKALQLCRQVERALGAIFACSHDAQLQSVQVVSVEPAPHSGRLRVTVVGTSPADATDRHNLEACLDRASGWIRTEVAFAVHRRKAPELYFVVLGPKVI